MSKSPENIEPNREEKEYLPYSLLGKITMMRHGETKYTGEYPDLTEFGMEQAAGQGEKMREKITDQEDVLIAHSPADRAKATADIVQSKMNTEEMRELRLLRNISIRDKEAFMEMVNKAMGPEKDFKKWERFYAHDESLNNRVDVIEPRSDIERRSLRALGHLIRLFNKYHEINPGKIPHFIGISHTEFINHVARDVFHLGPDQDQLNFGEMIEFTLLKGKEENPRYVPILATFRGETKEVVFDRKTRTIEVAKSE